MAAFAIHDTSGNITAVVIASEGAPPIGVSEPGLVVSEIELPSGLVDITGPESEQRVAESLKGYRIQGAIIRRS